MKNRKLIALKLEKFYKDVSQNRKNKKLRLQTDLEFRQNKTFDLNKKCNVQMFSTAVRGGNAFAAEQKIRELKKRIIRLLALRKNMKLIKRPNKVIEKATDDMNSIPMAKYGISPNIVEKKSLSSEAYREWFDIRCKQKISKTGDRCERYENKKYLRKKKQLCVPLEIGEDVLLLSPRLKKKDSPGLFYKSSTDNKPFYNKNNIYVVTNRQNIDKNIFYWIKNKQNKKKLHFRVIQKEIYTLSGNFA